MKRTLTLPGMRLVWAAIAIVLATTGITAVFLDGMAMFAGAVMVATGVGAVGIGMLTRRRPRVALPTLVFSLLGLFAGFIALEYVIVYAPELAWLPIVLACVALAIAVMPRSIERTL